MSQTLSGDFGTLINPEAPGGPSGPPTQVPPAGYVWVTDGQGGGAFQPLQTAIAAVASIDQGPGILVTGGTAGTGVVTVSVEPDQNPADISTSLPGDTAFAGSAGLPADSAHRHGREPLALAADVAPVGATAVAGNTGKEVDAGHIHRGVSQIIAGTGMSIASDDNNGHGAVTISLGSASSARTAHSVTTSVLAPAGVWQGTIAMALSYRVLRVAVSAICRVRLYDTAAHQAADATRPIGTGPSGDHGLVYEFVGTASLLAMNCTPQPVASSMETTPSINIPLTVDNLSGTNTAITVTLTFIAME